MKSFRERRAWLVGLVSIAVIAIGLGLAFSVNRFEALRGVYSLSAELEDAAGLQSGNEVRVAGVKVGRITGIHLNRRAAIVEMEIQDDVRVPVESKLEVKLKTLLGQKFVDLQMPPGYLAAASAGAEPADATDGFLEDGDVIPLAQTTIPYEIHQAATEGTRVLEGIDKKALRKLINVVAGTFGRSSDELGRALVSLDDAMEVLSPKGVEISRVLRSARRATFTLAGSDRDLESILGRSAEVLTTLAERRESISSLLAATNDLASDLGLLIRAARGSVDLGTHDLNSILLMVEGELDTLEFALQELPVAQEMFGRPLSFGRFTEGHACAVTTADTCVPAASPEQPGLPVHGIQPSPDPRRL